MATPPGRTTTAEAERKSFADWRLARTLLLTAGIVFAILVAVGLLVTLVGS